VSELALDGVGLPQAALIEHGRSCRAEAMASHFVLGEAQATQRGVYGVFGHATLATPH
jgi:hypothetical protein